VRVSRPSQFHASGLTAHKPAVPKPLFTGGVPNINKGPATDSFGPRAKETEKKEAEKLEEQRRLEKEKEREKTSGTVHKDVYAFRDVKNPVSQYRDGEKITTTILISGKRGTKVIKKVLEKLQAWLSVRPGEQDQILKPRERRIRYGS
jgi:hypothetical protein